MNIIADTHTHTVASGHAHSTLLENVRAAKSKGLRFLATTDHTGQMPGAPDPTYFACAWSTIPDECEGVYLLRGCEANILDEKGTLDLGDWYLDHLEWVIASIHSILLGPMDEARHTELWLNVAANPRVDVIGHCGEDAYRFDHETVVRAFAKYGKIVEINAASAKNRPSSQKNCAEIAKLCVKYGVPLVVSSDAHFAADVGEVSASVRLLREAGVPDEAVLNADAKRFTQRLHAMTGRTFDV